MSRAIAFAFFALLYFAGETIEAKERVMAYTIEEIERMRSACHTLYYAHGDAHVGDMMAGFIASGTPVEDVEDRADEHNYAQNWGMLKLYPGDGTVPTEAALQAHAKNRRWERENIDRRKAARRERSQSSPSALAPPR